MQILRRIVVAITLAVAIPVSASEAMKSGIFYKKPGCECCEEYAEYLRSNGF